MSYSFCSMQVSMFCLTLSISYMLSSALWELVSSASVLLAR